MRRSVRPGRGTSGPHRPSPREQPAVAGTSSRPMGVIPTADVARCPTAFSRVLVARYRPGVLAFRRVGDALRGTDATESRNPHPDSGTGPTDTAHGAWKTPPRPLAHPRAVPGPPFQSEAPSGGAAGGPALHGWLLTFTITAKAVEPQKPARACGSADSGRPGLQRTSAAARRPEERRTQPMWTAPPAGRSSFRALMSRPTTAAATARIAALHQNAVV